MKRSLRGIHLTGPTGKLSRWITLEQNPGSAIEFHLADNLRAIFSTLEPRGVGTWGVLALALFGIRGKCPFLRDCTWVLAPFLGLYLVGGIYGEIRVLYETFPIVLLLCLESLAMAVRRPLTHAVLPQASVGGCHVTRSRARV